MRFNIPRRVQIGVILILAAYTAFQGALYVWGDGRRGRFRVESPYFILVTLCLIASLPALRGFRASATAERSKSLFALAWCILLAFVAYWPTLSISLLSDDFVLLQYARQNTGASDGGASRRPLAVWLFNLVVTVAGPSAFHALLVFLHAANGWLLIRLSLAIGFEPAVASLIGVLFLTFPASVEAVTWCSGVQDVLMTTCVLVRHSDVAPAVVAVGSPSGHSAEHPSRHRDQGNRYRAAGPVARCMDWNPTAAPVPHLGNARDDRRRRLCGMAPSVWRYTRRLHDVAFTVSRQGTIGAFIRVLSHAVPPRARSFSNSRGPRTPAVSMPFLVGYAALSAGSKPDLVARAIKAALWILVPALPVYVYFFVAPDLQGSRYLYLGSARLGGSPGQSPVHCDRAGAWT